MTRSTAAAAAKPAFLALSCVGFIASAPAYASDVPPVPANDPVKDDDAQAQSRDDILVNGQRIHGPVDPKATAPLVNTPKSIVVLPREVIEQTGSASLADALRTVPGITFGAAEGGNPIGDRPFIRGFDSQGSTFLDGVRDLASQTREVFAVEQIQVVRGSDSTLGGRGGAGGSINIISKLPVQGDFARVDGSFGNADYKRVTGDVNYNLTSTIGVRVAAMWHDQDVAGRDAIWSRRWGVAPSFTIGLGTPTRLTAAYYHLTTHELPDSGIPYLYTIGNAPGTGNIYTQPALGDITLASGETGHVSRSTFYGLVDRDFRDSTTDQATLRVEHDFGGLTLRNTSRYSHNNQEYIFLLPDDSQGNVYGNGHVWRRGNTRYGYTESLTNQTDLYGTFHTGAIEHSIALGAEVSWEKARRGAFVSASGSTINPRCNTDTIARYYCTSLFDPNPNDPWVNYASDTSDVATPIVKGSLASETQNVSDTQSVYAFDSITLIPQLILNLGARYDHFTSTLTGPGATATDPLVKLSRSDDLFNWQAGLVFKPTPETSLYASYATSATPPNSLLGEGSESNGLQPGRGGTISIEDLKVTKTKSYEVGAKANLFHEQLALGIAAFQTDTSNARVTDENGDVGFIGKTRIRGVELTANGTIVKGWSVFGGYTYLDPIITDGGFTALTAAAIPGGPGAKTVLVPSVNTGKQTPQTAKNSFTIWTTVQPIHRLSIGGGAFYTSRQFGGYADNRTATQDAAGTVTVNPATKVLYRTIPGYWRFDARLGFDLTKHVSLSVNAQNLTNKTYFNQTFTSHYAAIAAGRTVFGSVGVKF